MKNKRILSKIFVIVLITVLLFISLNVYATQANIINDSINTNEILSTIKKEKIDFNSSIETELNCEISEVPEMSTQSKQLLNSFNKEVLDVKTVKKVYDNALDRETIRISSEEYEIDLDNNGNILNYKNLEDFSTEDKYKTDYIEGVALADVAYQLEEQQDLNSIINLIETENNLENYKLIDCSNNIEGVWFLTWYKDYGNNLLNSYDCVNVAIDAKDGSIMMFSRNTMLPNTTEAILSSNEAIEIAEPIISEYCDKETNAELTFFRPNYYFSEGGPYEIADFVRLSWNVSTDKCTSVQIDATTGEVLGGSKTKTDCGRAMSVVNFLGQQELANLASAALTRLGYDQTNYPPVSWSISQTDIDWMLSRPDMYGLYLSCHGGIDGDLSVLSDGDSSENSTWEVWSNQSFGNWHFVYLDACLTSANNNFATAFGTIASGRGFVGWNHEVYDDASLHFNRIFLPSLGSMSVHNAVVQALTQTRNAGYYCDPGFIGDTAYYGWAW